MTHHLALPIAVAADGRLAALPIDSPAEIAQSVGLLLATRPGERRSVPEYGTPDPRFGGADVDGIAEAIEEWEDRADPVLIDRIVDGEVETLDIFGSAPVVTDDAATDTADGED